MKTNLVLYLRDGDRFSAFMLFVNYLIKKFNLIEIETVNQLNYFLNKQVNSILIPYNFASVSNIDEKSKFILSKINQGTKILRFFNEYNLAENGSLLKIFKQYPVDLIIVNFEKDIYKRYYKRRVIINCNCLSYKRTDDNLVKYKKYDTPIYYGTFRIGRVSYFQKYINNNSNIIFSCSKRNYEKMKKYNVYPAKWIEKINIEQLRYFKYSLYIEDEETHNNYSFPANRFYECLSNKVVLFFDKSCVNTFNRYGIDISEFIVDGKDDLDNKIKQNKYEYYLSKQQAWCKKAEEDLLQLEKDVEENIASYFL